MKYSLIYIFSFLMLLTFSCVPTKMLKENEYLLFSQAIEGNKEIPVESLEVFYKQKPNRRILYLPIMPYLYAYSRGSKKYAKTFDQDTARYTLLSNRYKSKIENINHNIDSVRNGGFSIFNSRKSKRDTTTLVRSLRTVIRKRNKKLESLGHKIEDGNWLMRAMGEAPSIYDSTSTKNTQEQLSKFLKIKGYFDNIVTSKTDTAGKKISVTYQIVENKPKIIQNVILDISDTSLFNIVAPDTVNSIIKIGNLYTQNQLERERTRIDKFLKNQGYFDFGKSYIFFEVDTTAYQENSFDVKIIIKNPLDELKHKRYSIKEVAFYADATTKQTKSHTDTLHYKDISQILGRHKYSKKVIDRKLFIRPDSLFKLLHTEQTQIALASLDIFKFVNINYEKLDTNSLKASVFSSPYKKYQLSDEWGLSVNQSLPGPFGSVSLKVRNPLRRADIFEVRFRAAIEAQTSVTDANNTFSSKEFSLNTSFTVPDILFPISKKMREKIKYAFPKTKFNVGIGSVTRPEYTRINTLGSINYKWRNRKNANFNIGFFELSLIQTSSLSEAFAERLVLLKNSGNNLELSFGNSIVSDVNFTYSKASDFYGSLSKKSNFLRLYFEAGGNYLNFLGKSFFDNNETFFGLRFFRYYKFQTDFRFGFPMGKGGKSEIASRINVGLAQPYGDSSGALPYEKYFFSGGSSSNRAWRSRRVGPGSYTPSVKADGTFDDRFEQNGELLIELNAEWRRKLYGFIDGALFIDATNVWMLTNDKSRVGANFEIQDFWKEFAIGAGFGLRFDFSFLIIRLDTGIKIYDPARPLGSRFIGNKVNFKRPFGEKGQAIFNLGIGYPF